MNKNNDHLYLFPCISFLAILLIIVFAPKSNMESNPYYFAASTTSYNTELRDY